MKNRSAYLRQSSVGKRTGDRFFDEETPLVSASRVELPTYQSTLIDIKEEKFVSHYVLSDEHLTVIPLSQLENLLFDNSNFCIRLGDNCWIRLENFRIHYLRPFLASLIFLPTSALIGYGIFRFMRNLFKTLDQFAKTTLDNWNTLLSINGTPCALAYREVAECMRIPAEAGPGDVAIRGISESVDSICHKALWELCQWGCNEETAKAKDCTENILGEEIFRGVWATGLYILAIIALFLCVMVLIYRRPFSGPRPSPSERRLFNLFLENRNIFEETKFTDLKKDAEKTLDIVKKEIDSAKFFVKRHQLIAEKLPVFEQNKATLANIVDEYLGITMR